MSKDHQNKFASSYQRPLRIGDWLWRPVYAKLWWTTVPFYWGGMAASEYVKPVGAFYDSAASGFLTIFFFPPLVAVILCFGFFREWLVVHPHANSDSSFADEMFLGPDSFGPSAMPWEFDPMDSRSGAQRNGSPLNPNNPGYVNRAS